MARVLLNLSAMAVAALAICVPLAVVFGVKPSLAELQTIAQASCKCARLKQDASGKAECWRSFEVKARQAGKFVREGGISACMGPIARRRCLAGTQSCVITGYSFYPGPFSSGDAFCSPEEAADAVTVFDSPYETWDAALLAKQQKFMHGGRLAGLEGFTACGG
jgi:hypothetical protein